MTEEVCFRGGEVGGWGGGGGGGELGLPMGRLCNSLSWLSVCLPGPNLQTPPPPYPSRSLNTDVDLLHTKRCGTRSFYTNTGSNQQGTVQLLGMQHLVKHKGSVDSSMEDS